MNKILLIWAFGCLSAVSVYAQTSLPDIKSDSEYCTPVQPYEIEVCYDKTMHIIFPSAIIYVDLGSRDIIADKAGGAENVLRVKAANRDFRSQTNISVITDKGDFYTFDVRYSENPAISSLEMRGLIACNDDRRPNNTLDVHLRELGEESPRTVYAVMSHIYACNERRINHIGGKGFGIQFLLRGLYSHNGVLYIQTRIRNSSNIRYDIDFIVFKIVDKKIAKRTAIQERIIEPLRTYNDVDIVEGHRSERTVYAFDMFTIPDDKRLVVELRERNGGRHLSFTVENADIVRAKVIDGINMK